jgi:hypothetical protein
LVNPPPNPHSCFCPWGSLAAGDHYFEWRNYAEPYQFVSVLFVITQALNLTKPVIWSEESTLFKGTSYFVFYHSLSPKLPSNLVSWIEAELNFKGFNPTPFTSSLQTICDFYYAPFTPQLSPTRPLENQ